MNFMMLPPEINSLRMYCGAGSGPMLEAAAGWSGLAEELEAAAGSFSSVTSALACQAWQGPAAAAMAAAAAPYAGWLNAASAQAANAAGQAQAVVSAFEAAQAAMIHPLLVAANRNTFVRLVMSNLFGFNAPAIAAAEFQYEEMWAQDVAAMVGYHGGVSAAAAQLASPAQALQNLPGLAANAAANAAADLGFGNLGWDNVGFFNSGVGNFGIFNNGQHNVGAYNKGDNNVGVGNNTPDKGYCAPNGQRYDAKTTFDGNFGAGNFGHGNVGAFNNGVGNSGIGNVGDGNAGLLGFASGWNTGNSNSGFSTSVATTLASATTGTATSASTTRGTETSAASTWGPKHRLRDHRRQHGGYRHPRHRRPVRLPR